MINLYSKAIKKTDKFNCSCAKINLSLAINRDEFSEAKNKGKFRGLIK